MILVKNEQDTVKVYAQQLQKDSQIILDALNYNDFDLGIKLTTNREIHSLNKEYRKKDKPTDILSFPYHPELSADEHIVPKNDEDKNLGDIIISPEFVQQDLPRWEQTFEQRMRFLFVHDICHLLGYDHIKDKDYRKMHKKEVSLLALLEK